MEAVSESPPTTTSEGSSLAVTRKRYFLHGLLPQLIAFEACVRLGGVTSAARELRLAQPSVSCLVRKLSITFGGQLVVRRRGRMEPTELGGRVLVLTREMLDVLSRFDSKDRWRRASTACPASPVGTGRLAQRAGLEERAPM